MYYCHFKSCLGVVFVVLFCHCSFLLFLSSLVIWYLSLYLDPLLFMGVCIYYRFLVCSCHFKCVLTTIHFYSPHKIMFFILCFACFCFVYLLITYCGYKWFYYFCLLASLLALCMDDFLLLLSVFNSENFHFVVFLFLNVAFSFLPREIPLAFLVKLVWLGWVLLAFASLESICFLHQIRMRALLSRVFWVVDFPLSLY